MFAPTPSAINGRRTVTRAFRTRMIKNAAFVFGVLIAVLLILVGTVDHKVFLICALVLIPTSALTFNLLTRRAYRADRQARGLKA